MKDFVPVGALCGAILAVLLGCRAASRKEPHRPAIELSQSHIAPASDDECGIADFPASRSAREVVAAAPPPTGRPGSGMLVRVAIDAQGSVTHLRVLRLAYPASARARALNEAVVERVKGWRYKPLMVSGKAVAVCSDVAVTIDF